MKSNTIKKVLITSGVDGGRGWVGDVKNMLPTLPAQITWVETQTHAAGLYAHKGV